MRRGWLLSLVASAAVVVSGCTSADDSGDSDGRISVVASTSVYASIAAAVGGQYVDTMAFIASAGQDPHSYEASGRDILAVSKADLVIENGGGYDDFMAQLIDSAGGDRHIIDVVDSSGIAGRDEPDFNEHVWYNLATMQATADQIAAALADIDPAHRGTFVANAANFDGQVQQLIDRADRLRAQLQGAPVGVTEPVPDYLLDSLGLDDITPEAFTKAVEDGDDVAVSTLAETLDLATDHKIDALVYNDQTTGLISDQFLAAARDAEIPVVAVSETLPEGADYVSWMSDNLTRIADALEQ